MIETPTPIDHSTRKGQATVIKNTPLPNCPQCHGTGKYVNKLKMERPCVCRAFSEPDPEVRMKIVVAFRKSIKSLSDEFHGRSLSPK